MPAGVIGVGCKVPIWMRMWMTMVGSDGGVGLGLKPGEQGSRGFQPMTRSN